MFGRCGHGGQQPTDVPVELIADATGETMQQSPRLNFYIFGLDLWTWISAMWTNKL